MVMNNQNCMEHRLDLELMLILENRPKLTLKMILFLITKFKKRKLKITI